MSDPYKPGYGGGAPRRTADCGLCWSRNPTKAHGGRKPLSAFKRRAVWRDSPLCDDCYETTRGVTFHATWTERLPRDEADAVAKGDVLETAEIEWDRLTVTSVEEHRGAYGQAGIPETHVWLSDKPPPD